MQRAALIGWMVVGIVAAAGQSMGRGYGGRGGRRNSQPTPQEQAAELRRKTSKLLDDGFESLREFDTAGALEDFSDVLQLAPDNALAHVGLGLARAQQGRIGASETEFSAASYAARQVIENPPPPTPIAVRQPNPRQFFANQQPDPDAQDPKNVDPRADAESDLRLATFDLAVAYSRLSEKPRALMMIDRLMLEKHHGSTGSPQKDELTVNALRCLIASLDDKAQSSIAALPNILKDLEKQYNLLLAIHSPLRRWGVTWMEASEVARYRASRETEPLPEKLPFLLPDESVLPEGKKPEGNLVNPLLPIIMTTTPRPDDSTAIGSPAAPDVPSTAPTTAHVMPAGGEGTESGVRRPERVLSGAAFAVSSDTLLTVSRLVVGARTITLQAVDGTIYSAEVAASDPTTGLALIKVAGGHFAPYTLATRTQPESVTVPAFTRPGIFSPEMQVIVGELIYTPGLWSLRTSTQPRSPGCPLLNRQGRIAAVLVATRDDPLAHLPVVTIDPIRKFLEAHLAGLTPSDVIPNPEQSVLELSAIRREEPSKQAPATAPGSTRPADGR